MSIVNVSPTDRAGFLDLVNAEIRPDRAKTNAWDDFPVILGAQNSPWQLIYKTPEGHLAGCIACLIRDHQTSCGVLSIAGIGSVVTHPNFRGQGVSKALQNELLERLKRKNIPLAVLWTDQPEIYSGRGFQLAGWEFHFSLAEITCPDSLPAGYSVRSFNSSDTKAVEDLFHRHSWRTQRLPGDSLAYYTMPGTQGIVLTDAQKVIQAAAFCGKGGDFPNYITEFSGDPALVVWLFHEANQTDLAHQVLVPAGAENMAHFLVELGAPWFAQNSGLWAVLNPDSFARSLQKSGFQIPGNIYEPAAWLGSVDLRGQPVPGPLTAAIWGFDSV